MSRVRTALAPVLLAIVAGACDESPDPTGPRAPRAEILDVSAPDLTSADLVLATYTTLSPTPTTAGGDGPRLADDVGYDEMTRPLQQIFRPDTRVRFEGDFAYSLGVHKYIGNVGRVETTAWVRAGGGQEAGSATTHKQDYTPFLADLGEKKSIWVQARVSVESDCGLTVDGQSTHKAWWQFYFGTGAAAWGVASESTQADPVSQGACTRQTSTATLAEDAPSGVVCYYYIVYDVVTLEILSMDFLYCASAGAEML